MFDASSIDVIVFVCAVLLFYFYVAGCVIVFFVCCYFYVFVCVFCVWRCMLLLVPVACAVLVLFITV